MTGEIYKHLNSENIQRLLTLKNSILSEIYSLLKKEKAIDGTFLKFETDLKNKKLKPQFTLVYKNINGNKELIGVATEYTYYSNRQKKEIFTLHNLTISKAHRTERLELELLDFVSKQCRKQGFLNLNINLDERLEKILEKLIKQKRANSENAANTKRKTTKTKRLKTSTKPK